MADTVRGKLVIDTQMPVDEAKKQLADLQNTLNKLKIPTKLSNNFADTFKGLDKQIDILQKKLNTGLKTNTDIASFEKTNQEVQKLYGSLDHLMVKLRDMGDSVFAGQTTDEIERLKSQVDSLRGSLSTIGQGNSQLAKLKQDFGEASNYSQALKDRVREFYQALESGNLENMEKSLQSLGTYANRYSKLGDDASDKQKGWVNAYNTASEAAREYQTSVQSVSNKIDTLSNQVISKENALLEENRAKLAGAREAAADYGQAMNDTAKANIASSKQMQNLDSQIDQLVSRASYVFSLTGAFMALRSVIRSAYEDVKELDEAMTSIAVVTDFTTDQLWGQVDAYAELAQEMGVSLVGVYDVQKLYYQQGRDAADVASLTTDTLRFARIAEMDYADATDAMTVAINAFKLEASDATRVIDIYSQLAARAAVDQSELATAMSKVASMASSVGMSLETTSAFLTQIIETTRESPETA